MNDKLTAALDDAFHTEESLDNWMDMKFDKFRNAMAQDKIIS